ncbi:MAG: acyltransferase [Firmicutes bacterium]|nr:acyltransferase [Bacillota bacterium]
MEKTIQEKDYSISCARLIAMVFIVACHMMQMDGFSSDIKGAHIEWAFWFNVGVQMFLFISGYLYGKKDRIDIVEFYKKNFPKLLVDYYIFIAMMLVVIHFSPAIDVNEDQVIGLLTFSGTVSGLGHLWFIPTILFCYLLTPAFSAIINEINKRSSIRFWIEALLLLYVIHKIVHMHFKSFDSAWINCFVIGMIYNKIEQRKKSRILFIWIVVVLCMVMIPVQFRLDYWPHGELPRFFSIRYWYFKNYGHVFLGILIVLIIRCLYKKNKGNAKKHPVLDWCDKYSYDVYLVHHVFVQSAFACVIYISNRQIALPLAVLLTVCFAMLLYHVSKWIRTLCIAVFRRLPN